MSPTGTPRKPSAAATLTDVAAQAGVSPATVSRVLAGNYPVSRSARQRVQRALRELNYVANTHARALAGVRTKTIAFVLADVRGPSFAEAAHGVEQEAASHGWLCLIGTTQGDQDRELALVRLMQEQRAGAVILIGAVDDDAKDYRKQITELARSLQTAGSLLVLCGRPPLDDDVPAAVIGYDNSDGAYALTSHLLARGHRRILFLAGGERNTTSLARLAGHRRALTTFGVEFDPDLVAHGSFTRASGYQLTRRRLLGDRDFTAVFAATDAMAAGVYTAATERGLRIPDDLSVVGYDDVELAQDLRPRLTSVHVPYEELGRTAARVGMAEDHQREDWPGVRLELKTHVVIRDSVAQLG
ncbi:LacI family transcriptional regulator [Kribbella sp. VKM Ac-2527]|uniref:LacI family transcriptional regulator n=1 Tax=Kribbella caucasensis TaxID=2512215 RepID=A0A4R6J5M8_9ACTN|nr:LacI family DNA-binding transcriptional regulator [Kribbella sp. VKM Ac-2527]TDO29646.1 LacI family transcriptional regulator [Kribbella sp. VKM Ac-2527]